jgi:hypothetical protein
MATGACDGAYDTAWGAAPVVLTRKVATDGHRRPGSTAPDGRHRGAVTLYGLSDNPDQFRRDPMLALMNQAQRARKGHADGGINYLTVPF